MIEGSAAAANDPEERLRRSNYNKQWWADPTNKEKRGPRIEHWLKFLQAGHAIVCNTEEYKNKLSNRLKKQWLGKWGTDRREYCASTDFRQHVSEGTKIALDNDVIREKLSILASNNQANGVIGPNKTRRLWHMNPFTNVEEHFDSGWEVCVFNEAVKRNIAITRSTKTIIPYEFNGRKHRYVPDFVSMTGKTLIEVKGMKTNIDELKIQAAIEFCELNNIVFVLFDTQSSFVNNDLWSLVQ